MGWIAEVEDALIARLKIAFTPVVKTVESQPGPWTLDALKRALQFAPGIYVAYNGHRRVPEIAPTHAVARFEVYVVSKNAAGDLARRRGDITAVGAYELAEGVTAVLHEFDITQHGYMKFVETRNLFQEALLDIGGTVYAASFEIVLDVAPYPSGELLDRLKQVFTATDMDTTQDDEPLAEQLVRLDVSENALLDHDGEALFDHEGTELHDAL